MGSDFSCRPSRSGLHTLALAIRTGQGMHRLRIRNWPGDGMNEIPEPAAPPGRRRASGTAA